MMSELVSVIVPVYNVDQYLDKCITSIVNQSYKELEIILVDDGSTDTSPEICEKYAKEDHRITVIHKNNEGLVNARKDGIRCSHGVYIANVDSDDWLEQEMLQTMLNAITTNHADIVCVNHYVDYGNKVKLVKNKKAEKSYTIEEIIPTLLYNGFFFEGDITLYLWSKLFKREILIDSQLSVNELICSGEDVATVIPAMLKAKTIQVLDYAGYHYVQRKGSIVDKRYENEQERDFALINYLSLVFNNSIYSSILKSQLQQYKKNLLLLRNFSWFDGEHKDFCLAPFGNIPYDCKVVLYAAGRFGQNLFEYLSNNTMVKVTKWCDQDYIAYTNMGYPVCNPNEVDWSNDDFDFVIISAISERIACMIKKDLLNYGVAEEKIRWLTKKFLSEDV